MRGGHLKCQILIILNGVENLRKLVDVLMTSNLSLAYQVMFHLPNSSTFDHVASGLEAGFQLGDGMRRMVDLENRLTINESKLNDLISERDKLTEFIETLKRQKDILEGGSSNESTDRDAS